MKNLLNLAFLTLILFSCGNASSTDNESSPDKIAAEITALESEYGADPGAALSRIEPLLAKYEEYVSLPQADENKKVVYLISAGEMAALIKQYDKAIGYYERVITEFPNSAKAATALFMKAYTLDDKLNRLDDAKAVYEAFIAKYPNDDFADDAQFLLDNLGKSEEEIIKQFESKK